MNQDSLKPMTSSLIGNHQHTNFQPLFHQSNFMQTTSTSTLNNESNTNNNLQQIMLSQNIFNTLNPEQRLRFALDTIQTQNLQKTQNLNSINLISDTNANNNAGALAYLFVENTCQWPECQKTIIKNYQQFVVGGGGSFEKFQNFHLMQEHLLDENSHNQVIKQMHLVKTIEGELSKQKNILNSMLIHLNNQMVKIDFLNMLL